MNGIGLWLFGPLVVPECRRALVRGWVVLLRGLAAVLLAGIALCILWWWWTAQQIEPNFRPYSTLRFGLTALLATEITIALIMTPALLAGSLAGEKERGSLALLMTTRVSPREIVTGRAMAKLSQIGMVLLTGLPAMILLAELASLRPPVFLAILLQPFAVAFGIGGVALATSAMTRRGRDALLAVYLLIVLTLFVPPLVGLLPVGAASGVILWLSPYHGMVQATWEEDPAGSFCVIGLWTAFGLAGVAIASWRLRPSWLKAVGGDERGKVGRRNLWIPPIGDRPILWKELHIERAGSLGRVGKWLGLIVIAYLALGSTILAANVGWYLWVADRPLVADSYRVMLAEWVTDSSMFISALIQLAVALRAAVAVSSERERGTWDGLLSSPLEGKELIGGKLWGSLYALRLLFLAALWAWVLALSCGAMTPRHFAGLLLSTFLISAYSAAAGVRISLGAATATKAMTVTVLVWMVSLGGFAILASAFAGVAGLAAMVAWDQAYTYGLVATLGGPRIMVGTFAVVWWPSFFVPFVVATLIVLSDSRLRFDRLSGRMTGGALAVRLDDLLHGQPLPPVAMGTAGPLGAPHHAEDLVHHDPV